MKVSGDNVVMNSGALNNIISFLNVSISYVFGFCTVRNVAAGIVAVL
jgi:hypothetical protein